MKKIIILLLLPFLLGGCFDYQELNNLAIVSGIAIDYDNDKYELTLEIISTKTEKENSSTSKTYTLSSKGKTMAEAFDNIGDKADKILFYEQLNVVAISEEIAENHLQSATEYLFRSPEIRIEFIPVIVKASKAKEVLSATDEVNPVASLFIEETLKNSPRSSNAGYYAPFTEIMTNILTGGKDAIMSVFEVKDKKITLTGMGLFKDYKLKEIVDIKDAYMINFLTNFETSNVLFEYSCGNNNYTMISIEKSKVDISADDKKITVSAKLEAEINEDGCKNDLRDSKSFIKLQKEFTKIIEKEMLKTINTVKKSNTNVLYIGKNYYNKTRKENYFLWRNQEVEFDIKLNINKRGLIFEVEK